MRVQRDKVIHGRFEEHVNATPGMVAVVSHDQQLTYSQLNECANRLAHYLIRTGVRQGTLVGLCMERSVDVVVGLLAILKAGGAYVPLDPNYPDERLDFMLRDTAAPIILAHATTTRRLEPFARQTRIVCLQTDASIIAAEPTHNIEIHGTLDDLAYVIYTSGSTGTPKGVVVTHRPVIRRVCEIDYCHLGSDEVVLHLAPLAFDASTFEIWGPLLNGGRVALLRPGPPALDMLGSAIRQFGVTTMFLTTALFNLAVEQRVTELGRLRQLLMGGELVSPRHVREALAELLTGRLLHVYGPTECTTFASCFPMSKGYPTEGGVPIGRAICNTICYVLDEQLRPVPAGTPGELYIGGEGLALGYLNNPELTHAKFIHGPLSAEPAERLYRTGDRVCARNDGNLDFLGRFDYQVKIRGHRIEPGEIEATLRQHPDVRQCVVVARAQERGEKQLVGYVVPVNPDSFSAETLKRYLARRLPQHMVPAYFLCLRCLPLNPNGKVDHAALPAPAQQTIHGTATVDSQPTEGASGSAVTEMEKRTLTVWRKVLNRDVGTEENFFDVGGTSMQMLEIHAELIKLLGRSLAVTELFEHATIRSLARWLAGKGDDSAFAKVQDRAQRQKEAFARWKNQAERA